MLFRKLIFKYIVKIKKNKIDDFKLIIKYKKILYMQNQIFFH